MRTASPSGQRMDAVQIAGFVWFEVLMTGSYLGAASALVEHVLTNDRVPEHERVGLLIEIEGASAAVEAIARRVDAEGPDEATLADSLYVRYCAQDTIARVVPRAVELWVV